MLNRLLGTGSTVARLKAGLDESVRSVRGIAHRVANASTPGSGGFGDVLREAQGVAGRGGPGAEGVDLEKEMVALADEQLRYEATSRLLQKVYQQLRSSVRER